MADKRANKRFRSQEWFDNPNNPGMTALYLERYQNQEYTLEELQSGRPVIGIAQTGSDLSPCNKIHVFLMDRIKAGIRDGGGIPMEFPVHPIQETARRPTAALDRTGQPKDLTCACKHDSAPSTQTYSNPNSRPDPRPPQTLSTSTPAAPDRACLSGSSGQAGAGWSVCGSGRGGRGPGGGR